MADRIAVGVIRTSHGLRGEASVEPWTNAIDRFHELTTVTLVSPSGSETRGATIESVRAHGDRALIKFAEIASPEEVRTLRGWTIEIPESEARPLESGEFFLHDLIGMRMIDEGGQPRGEVVDAYEGGGGVLLNVRRADGKMYEVPFAAAICRRIDLAAKTISVDLPEGIDAD
ncbi:MAG TPA: ribosome maturation factor RimM [Thermoanaerobaculia bacterium]|jgi:16S rRNA processing protein RimM|nr:ribosome maturation factor RimM [Thermoanaerobaculia bacterium]